MEITSVVGFVGQVKRLEYELQVPTLMDPNVLGDAHIHVKECIASNRVIADLVALTRSQARQCRCGIEARARVVECRVVFRIGIWNDYRPGITASTIQNIETRPQVIRSR